MIQVRSGADASKLIRSKAWGKTIAIALVATMVSGEAPAPRYAEGQVWEYNTRPQDAGSLVKIQKIERLGPMKVYHLSIIGLRFRAPGASNVINHIPVSDATLDASVTRPARRRGDFSAAMVEQGIAEWRRANGGVFTVTIAAIVNIVDEQISTLPQDPSSL